MRNNERHLWSKWWHYIESSFTPRIIHFDTIQWCHVGTSHIRENAYIPAQLLPHWKVSGSCRCWYIFEMSSVSCQVISKVVLFRKWYSNSIQMLDKSLFTYLRFGQIIVKWYQICLNDFILVPWHNYLQHKSKMMNISEKFQR